MKSLLLVLFITSCSSGGYYSYSDGNWHAPIYHESKIVCHKDYIYNQHTGYCHYSVPPHSSLAPKLETKSSLPIKDVKKPIKAVKKDIMKSNECVKAISKMKQCGIGVN